MKKFLTVLLILTMVFAMTACGGNDEGGDAESYAVAMITDYGDITDESFNQTTYEACKEFCEANGIKFNYFKPAGDNTADRVAMVDQAVGEGYNVIVMPGYAFGGTVVEAAPNYPDVKFIVLDVSKGDILEAAVTKAGETYDYQPDNWNLEDYFDMSNVYCVVYQEEIAGYMAGYAAVKLGYEKLGFLGGMAVPAVVRYGQGFVQGCDAAAAEMNKDIDLNYVYGGQFFGNADITAVMDTWYKGGTEVVFAAGGSIYTSACEAAVKVVGKVSGVDTDQAPIIDGAYCDGITLTSAMKGLYPSTYNALEDIVLNGNWDKYVGQIANLGIISDNPEENYVQIAPSTQFKDGAFTEDDYKAMVAKLNAGEIKVDNNIAEMPKTTNTKVNVQGQIVG